MSGELAVNCFTLVDLQRRTHGFQLIPAELVVARDRRLTLNGADYVRYSRQTLSGRTSIPALTVPFRPPYLCSPIPLMRLCLNVRPKDAFSSPALKSSDSTAGSRSESGSESKLSEWRLREPRCQKCCNETAEYSVCDGWQNGDSQSVHISK